MFEPDYSDDDFMAEEEKWRHWDERREPAVPRTCRTCTWGAVASPAVWPQLSEDLCFCMRETVLEFVGDPDEDMAGAGCWEQ